MPLLSGKVTPTTRVLFCAFLQSKTLSLTQQLHAQITLHGLHRDVLFGSKITNTYVELGFLEFAYESFNHIATKNIHSWNTILSGYSKSRLFRDVLLLYNRMRRDCNGVDSFNSVFAIKACIGLLNSRNGKLLHCLAIKSGLERDPYVAPSLVEMSVELTSTEDARKLFDGVPKRSLVLWGVMMKGYLKVSRESEVFDLFLKMRDTDLGFSDFTLECVVRACGYVKACNQGKAVHGLCIKRSFANCSVFLQTSILDMYLSCGLLECGLRIFEQIDDKNVVLWTSLIVGFEKNARAAEAMSLFGRMLSNSLAPNEVTLASILSSCSRLKSLKHGKSVHGYVIRNRIEMDAVNYTCFIDMYGKCGCVEAAQNFFENLQEKNVFAWTAMINAFGMHGLFREAFACFEQMKLEKQSPNPVTFVSILSVCSHSGKLEEGFKFFESMSREYGINPTEEHYACMVDLLGRAGKMDEAVSFIDRMPIEAGALTWRALLSACKVHKHVELAKEVAKKLLPLESGEATASAYVLLSNIYADAEMWDLVKEVRGKMRKLGFRKSMALSAV